MIISDKNQYVFVHIPKCAGSSIRNSIKLNDEEAIAYGGIRNHYLLGTIDYADITASYLEKYFEEEYKKILKYFAFAILRNPYNRTHSSLLQLIRMHKGTKLINVKRKIVIKELEEAIQFLNTHANIEQLPPEYIHFQKQKDYIFNNKEKVVKNIYSINNLDKLFEDFMAIKNINIRPEGNVDRRLNLSLVHKNRFAQNLHSKNKRLVSSVVSKFPPFLINYLNSLFFDKPQNVFSDIFKSEYVKDFIEDYYWEDIELYNSLIKL